MKYPPWMEKMSFVRVLVISGILFFMGILFGFVTPPLFKKMVKKQLNLTPKSDVRELYVKTPFYLHFKVYMFNLLNPDEVTNGEKPKVQEIGPYFFEEWKEKFNLVDDEKEDTLSYHYKNTYIFRPDLSGPGLTGNEIITMPHPLITTMLLTVNADRKPMVPMAKNAIDIMFSNPQNMYYTGRVMDILFDGIPVDCSSEEFDAKAVCSAFANGEVKSARRIDDTHYAFSFFGTGNATDLGEVKVFRGLAISSDMGRVVGLNGEPEMDVWDGEECNEFKGTDSTIFPPYMDKNEGIWAFEPSVCRPLNAYHVGKSKYMGVKTTEFAIDIGSEKNTKQCYCRDEDTCPKKGTFDLYPCLAAAMIASMPHFYKADESLVANFASGINPVKKDHEIYMHFEMVTGTPLSAAKRLQFNLEMVPIEEVPYMANVQEMYYPLFWIEEGAALEKEYVKQIKPVLLVIKLSKFLKWFGLIFGFLGMMFAGVLVMIREQSGVQNMQPPGSATRIDVESIDK